MAHVFLSYNHVDWQYADRVRKELAAAGFGVWIDAARLQGFDTDWHQAVDNAIGQSFALVVIVTPTSVVSPMITYEWAFALGIGVEVIPVVFKQTLVPRRLSVLPRLDFSHEATINWPDLLKMVKRAFDHYAPENIRVSQEMQTVTEVDATVCQYELNFETGLKPGDFMLDAAILYAGRDGTNDIVLDQSDISRHHARFVHTQDGFTVEDMGSRNGTFVNDERIIGVRLLTDGDKLRFGEMVTATFGKIERPAE